ncbi:MAG TPA: hypothetical protein VFP50_16875 [Anaeromyxobacteraceae bacterium]|nr:hypothetical protein [Anaeromyxobacteraceae bacterium]
MSSWSCRYDRNGLCGKLDGAYCRPGMKGCILAGKVSFEDGVVPSPVWPPDHPRSQRKRDGEPGAG